MNIKQFSLATYLLSASSPNTNSVHVTAFSHTPRRDATRLGYRTYSDEYGDGDRMSLLTLLEEPTATNVAASSSSSSSENNHVFQEGIVASAFASDLQTKTSKPLSATPTASPLMHWEGQVDVDGDRLSLSTPLRLSSPIQTAPSSASTSSRPATTSSIPSSRATSRTSPITPLASLSDYNHHVLSPSNTQLTLIRFHAPWCQVCRTTSVAYERMASKLSKKGVRFLSVNIDNNNPECEKNVLKDMLDVEAVPMAVVYHPSRGVLGKVKLNRGNLTELKKRLGGYVSGALHRQGEMMWMEALLTGLLHQEERRGAGVGSAKSDE
ncbi:predicted protein [Thalassiosira pseudonana CCMP1335]|uniref:Thioredoxin domain-containing protein n=1 Tax=Thalassiosira pseudonana TaxID=35128 RepID=B8CGH4_THAPS|nr:predicted protein [Thalassiosira pseudonana CCMP1335]EED87496.1 predicted protein [Thalassiosira pseudonana CCMP1335]